MADKVELEVSIGPDGKVRIKTHGLKGEACLVETKGLEAAIGKVKKREKTKEAYEKAKVATSVGTKGR